MGKICDFARAHFENDVIQEVYPNFWAHHCIFDIKHMGVDSKILSLAMIKGEIWAQYDFDGGHFENDVIQDVHPNFVMAASTFSSMGRSKE